MPGFRQGDVITVPFHYTNRSARHIRQVVERLARELGLHTG
jgi:hypothetical protein